MKRKLRILRYIVIVSAAAAVGLVIANAVAADAQADETIKAADAFIQKMESANFRQVSKKSDIWANSEENVQISFPNGQKDANPDKKEQELASFTQVDHAPEEAADPDFMELVTGSGMTPEQFRDAGVIFFDGWKFTWYSEQVLPGEGLQIPGRWSDGDFVRDIEGFLCVACNDLEHGTHIITPFGEAIVYDSVGVDENGDMVHGLIDVYVSW